MSTHLPLNGKCGFFVLTAIIQKVLGEALIANTSQEKQPCQIQVWERGNLCSCKGGSSMAGSWAPTKLAGGWGTEESFSPNMEIDAEMPSLGARTRSMGYLWACGISSRCPWPRGFSWANRALCTFPTTAMCAQAFSILFTYLAKKTVMVVSG